MTDPVHQLIRTLSIAVIAAVLVVALFAGWNLN